MAITPLPTPPQRSDPVNFSARADTFMVALPTFGTEANALATDVNAKQVSAASSATNATTAANTATAAANAAQLASGVSGWVSGTTYAAGVSVWSLINFQTYRRKTAGAGTTDPYNDPTNWQWLSRQSTFTPIAVTALNIDLSLGDYFTKTIAANSTFTFSNVPAGGSSFMLKIRLDSGSIALPSSVHPVNGSIPTLATGKTQILMFESDDSGTTWWMVAAPNFTN